jgi:hypothetical protein
MNCLSSDGLTDDSIVTIVLLICLDTFACPTLFLHALLNTCDPFWYLLHNDQSVYQYDLSNTWIRKGIINVAKQGFVCSIVFFGLGRDRLHNLDISGKPLTNLSWFLYTDR